MNQLWSVTALDRVVLLFPVLVAVVLALAIVYRARRRRPVRTAEFWEPIVAALTVLLVFIGIYAGYASFRNQTRLAAETALNDSADALTQVEFARPELRCLYPSFGHDDPAGCRTRLASDPERWSLAILYVEETWFTLEKAAADRGDWGSQYGQTITYWADDVSEDVTGLFGYYLVNQEGAPDARRRMRDAGVCIPDLCASYSAVRHALILAKAAPRGPDLCAAPDVRSKARSNCP